MTVTHRALLLCITAQIMLAKAMQGHNRCKRTFTSQECVLNKTNVSLRVTKNTGDDDYLLQFEFCSSGQCINILGDKEVNWFKCKDVCKVCKSLPGYSMGNCPNNNRAMCERKVDHFIEKYCTNINASLQLHTTTPPCVVATPTLMVQTTAKGCSIPLHTLGTTSTLINTRNVTVTATVASTCPPCQWQPTTCISEPKELSSEITRVHTSIVTVTASPICPSLQRTTTVCTSSVTNDASSQDLSNMSKNTNTTALGVLLGLSILLIIAITMGWVCTCWLTKTQKKNIEKQKEQRRTGELDGNDEEEERVFNNPTYGGTSMMELKMPESSDYEIAESVKESFPRVTYAMYDAVKLPKSQTKTVQSGQTYDRLDRESISGGQVKSSSRVVASTESNDNYSQLGLPDQDIANNYHMIKDKFNN